MYIVGAVGFILIPSIHHQHFRLPIFQHRKSCLDQTIITPHIVASTDTSASLRYHQLLLPARSRLHPASYTSVPDMSCSDLLSALNSCFPSLSGYSAVPQDEPQDERAFPEWLTEVSEA